MPTLDPFSILMFTVTSSLLLCGMMVLMWAYRRDPSFVYWAMANGVYAAGWGLFALRFPWDINWLTLPLANILLLASPLLALEGLLQFLHQGTRRPPSAYLASAALLSVYGALLWWVQHDEYAPKIIASLTYGTISLLIAVQLARLEQQRLLLVRLVIGANLVIAGALFFRGGYAWANLGQHTPQTLQTVFNVLLLVTVTATMLQYLVFPLMAFMRSEEKLLRLALQDPLTEVANRRAFMEDGQAELMRSLRHGQPLAVLMLDIDHFKRINDEHGHPAGDLVLRQVARACRDALRPFDLVGRLGGEEFAVLLPQTTLADALIVAERLRAAIAALDPRLDNGKVIHATVSIGGTIRQPQQDRLDQVLAFADAALYAAKTAGRDRVVCH